MIDSLSTIPGQILTWAGALAGVGVVVSAGGGMVEQAAASIPPEALAALAEPHPHPASNSVIYLTVLGVGGILTTLGKLVYDDRKHARELKTQEMARRIDELAAIHERDRQENAVLREDLRKAADRKEVLSDRVAELADQLADLLAARDQPGDKDGSGE